MAIKLENHVKEIDGEKYVPLDIVYKHIAESYGNKFEELNNMMSKAFDEYNTSLKDIMND